MKVSVVFLGAALIMVISAVDARGDPKKERGNTTVLTREQFAPTCKLLDFTCSRAVGREYENVGDELTFKKSELTRLFLAMVAEQIGFRKLAYYFKPGAKPIPLPFLEEETNPLKFNIKLSMSRDETIGKMLFTLNF